MPIRLSFTCLRRDLEAGARASDEQRRAYCVAGTTTSAACFDRLAMRSEPAFAGSRKNAAAALNETAAIAINAHLKFSSARASVPGLNRANPCSAPAPAATPRLRDNCWATEARLTAALILAESRRWSEGRRPRRT